MGSSAESTETAARLPAATTHLKRMIPDPVFAFQV